MFKLKANINLILPIALALILPGLSLYTNAPFELRNSLWFFVSWLVSSIILYSMWQLLWYSWEVKPGPKRILVIAGLIGICVLSFTLYNLLPFSTIRVVGVARIFMAIILFLTIQYALKAQQNISHLQLEKERIQTESYRAQLKALRAQIDPHFLFNSMNTLRSMVRHKHANSEQFIMSLSDFYRQTLKHNENTTLPLSEELEVMESYLFLMKSRNEEAVCTTIEVDPNLHHLHLPTLALQVVVENCFKHNSMTSRSPLQIKVTNSGEQHILVGNNIQSKIGEEEPSGFGLDLLRKRYDLMNIDQGVVIEETPEQFIVKLKLISS